jgi:hypothetical protein
MPSTHPQINARLTAAQLAAVAEAAERADTSVALFVRWALAVACADQGVEFPDDMPGHGGDRRPRDTPTADTAHSV